MTFGKILRNLLFIFLSFWSVKSQAQDLDPRAYLRVPLGTTTVFSGFSFSNGEIVTDPTLPIENVNANVQSFTVGASRSFNILGKTSQFLMVLPYSWAQVTGDVNDVASKVTRSGIADMRMRFTMLLIGGPSGNLQDLKNSTKKTILGLGLHISAPTGEFFPDKLINLGVNRWAFRPELALSQPFGERWIIDLYSGVWLFTNNNSFFPGTAFRSQKPLGAFQSHLSYNIKPNLWVAIDGTYYVGGTSTVDGKVNDDRQDNTRIGITAVIPTGKFSSIKLTASTGAVVRVGQDFTTYSIGWQRSWLRDLKKKPKMAD
jgi:hypothetical protein